MQGTGWEVDSRGRVMRRWVLCALCCFALAAASLAARPALAGYAEGMLLAQKNDYQGAFAEFLAAAKDGDVNAQYALAVLYDQGLGTTQNFTEAIAWYRRAALSGHVNAQANLGFAYEEGRGVEQDYVAAAEWYRKAAEQGDVEAQANLGLYYASGQGVNRDDVEAHMWLNLAISRIEAIKTRRRLMDARDEVATRLTDEQLAEAQRRANSWKPEENN
jgi:TPR repeat protein